jgi:hypothetical protein
MGVVGGGGGGGAPPAHNPVSFPSPWRNVGIALRDQQSLPRILRGGHDGTDSVDTGYW